MIIDESKVNYIVMKDGTVISFTEKVPLPKMDKWRKTPKYCNCAIENHNDLPEKPVCLVCGGSTIHD